MDIYSFIRSKDVAEHCREIGKTWNTCEMAVIMARSDRSIDEKHAAWQELIDSYPDMPSIPNIHKISFESTHVRLAEMMDYERRLVKFFKTPEEGMYYRYRIHFDVGGDHHSRCFTSFEKAIINVKQEWARDETLKIQFDRMPIDATDDYDRRIEACTDYDGNLHYIYTNANSELHRQWFQDMDCDRLWEYELESMFFIDIPFPFKRGDLLTCGTYSSGAFVFDRSPASDPERYATFLRGDMGDGSDKGGWCFYVDDAGALYGDHSGPHDCFEYYRGKLTGRERLLHYVSLFIKDEIGLPELMNMQYRLVAENALSENFSIQSHGCYISDEQLAENRKED